MKWPPRQDQEKPGRVPSVGQPVPLHPTAKGITATARTHMSSLMRPSTPRHDPHIDRKSSRRDTGRLQLLVSDAWNTLSAIGRVATCALSAMACSPGANDSRSTVADASSDVEGDASSTPAMNASDATLSFAESVYPILRQNCTDHHSGSSPSGGLDMSDESRTFAKFAQDTTSEPGCLIPGSMEVEQYVWPGLPDKSLLYQKVSGVGIPPACGARMPYGGPYLSAADTDVIRDWIASGAAP
jgi:hypothetical protein